MLECSTLGRRAGWQPSVSPLLAPCGWGSDPDSTGSGSSSRYFAGIKRGCILEKIGLDSVQTNMECGLPVSKKG